MFGRSFRRDSAPPAKEPAVKEPVSFDDFELRLGDLMRGERATLGKSLLDVQRELKIKATYIAAIENSDPSAFDTPGFISGYVRSYARYLGMDPDWAYDTFCAESGFVTAHGMSPAASTIRPAKQERPQRGAGDDIFAAPATPFVPAGESFASKIEMGAVASVLVLVALIGGLGYGGWTVLQEVQKVQFAPIDQAPIVVAEVDPLAGGSVLEDEAEAEPARVITAEAPAPSPEALDRLYRPRALDVPIMTARDAPISTLNPSSVGALGLEIDTSSGGSVPQVSVAEADLTGDGAPVEAADAVEAAVLAAMGSDSIEDGVPPQVALIDEAPAVQVREPNRPEVVVVAIREAWVRVRSEDGSVLLERILQPGESYVVPTLENAPTLRTGDAGAVYFAVNGETFGPYGDNGAVRDGIALAAADLTETFPLIDPDATNSSGREAVQVAQAALDQFREDVTPAAE